MLTFVCWFWLVLAWLGSACCSSLVALGASSVLGTQKGPSHDVSNVESPTNVCLIWLALAPLLDASPAGIVVQLCNPQTYVVCLKKGEGEAPTHLWPWFLIKTAPKKTPYGLRSLRTVLGYYFEDVNQQKQTPPLHFSPSHWTWVCYLGAKQATNVPVSSGSVTGRNGAIV